MRGLGGRVLFCLGVSLAAMLVALVLLAPLAPVEEMGGWGRIVALFGHDSSLRRTCLASAAGLVVTACVFFRRGAPVMPSRRPGRVRPRSPGGAGA